MPRNVRHPPLASCSLWVYNRDDVALLQRSGDGKLMPLF
ncbi:hypothetical protein ACZ87_02908, partial [Candidatus Erwinia dacicola]